jgi:N-methylhydantoinase A
LSRVDQAAIDRIDALLGELLARCRRDLEADGVAPDRQRFQRLAECRYHGQGFELRASIPDGPLTLANVGDVISSFHQQHRLDYGYHFESGEVELITLRVIGREHVTPLKVSRIENASGETLDGSLLYRRPTTFDDGRTVDTPRYDRGRLKAGHQVAGPAILLQTDATTLLPPEYVAVVGEYGTLHIHSTTESEHRYV